jgi:hypothetical protein
MAVPIACASTAASTPPSSPAAEPTVVTKGSSAGCSFSEGGSVLIYEINAPKSFDAKYPIHALSCALLDCYNKARADTPGLHGKVTLRIVIGEAGSVMSVDAEPDGEANDPGLVSCASDVMKASAVFPKPGATVTVLAPLVFRP